MAKEFKSSFLTRSITASILTVPILAIVLIGNELLFLSAILATLFFASHEWVKNSISRSFFFNHIALLILFILMFLAPNKLQELTIFISAIFWMLFSLFLISNSTSKLHFIDFNNVFIRFLVIGSFFLCSHYILETNTIFSFSNYFLFLVFILNAAISDSAAYLSGTYFGKTRLFSEISPNKTFEGFVGGLLFSALSSKHRNSVIEFKNKEDVRYYEKGQEIGMFNLGSTVIILISDISSSWSENIVKKEKILIRDEILRIS